MQQQKKLKQKQYQLYHLFSSNENYLTIKLREKKETKYFSIQ